MVKKVSVFKLVKKHFFKENQKKRSVTLKFNFRTFVWAQDHRKWISQLGGVAFWKSAKFRQKNPISYRNLADFQNATPPSCEIHFLWSWAQTKVRKLNFKVTERFFWFSLKKMFFDQLKNGWKLTFSSYRLYKLQKNFLPKDCKTTNPELGISRKTDFM